MRNDMKSGMIRQDADISMFEALYTKTLFFVAEFEYNVLSLRDIFDDRYKFVEMAAHLRKVRNICNHSNEELLTEDCKKKTREYCRTLCKKIDEYEEKNN